MDFIDNDYEKLSFHIKNYIDNYKFNQELNKTNYAQNSIRDFD